jgi:hypothetical protein
VLSDPTNHPAAIMDNRIPPLRVRFIALAFAAVALGAGGCTAVQVAPGIAGEFRFQELQVMADQDFTRVYNAAKSGVRDMKLFQTQDDRKVVEAEIQARDAADALIIVKIKELGPKRTSVKIRYGIPGSLAPAQQLYQAIAKHY